MNRPLVSIVVPVFNAEKYLRQCVDSLVAQSYQQIEIILVNDGSTDQSLAICNAYQAHRNVKIATQMNQGLSGARNTGTSLASGKYITFIDADDWFEPNTIEVALECAELYECQLVMWAMIKEYHDKSIKFSGAFKNDMVFDEFGVKDLHRRLAGPIGNELRAPNLIDSFASAWGKLYRLDLIRQNKLLFVDTKIVGSEDVFFNFQYFGKINKAVYLHTHLIHYRKDNPTSLTKTHGSTLFPRFLNLFQYLRSEVEINKFTSMYATAIYNRVAISMMNIGLSETSPRFQKSLPDRVRSINHYLRHPIYSESYQHLQFQYLTPHWRLFYYLCKIKFGLGVFFMLKIMRLFVNR